MADISIRTVGRVGRITLDRPDALNALTWSMIREIRTAVGRWASDDAVAMLVIDAEGDKAFCAGGDLTELYAALAAGDQDTPRRFWREEYAMNAALFDFPKPVASFLQGYTMGGGVGVGCHASHRVVCEGSAIALPECSIGLVPDVGSSLLLARAPGRLGEYLGLTGARADPGSAIAAGLADYFIPRQAWQSVMSELIETGDWTLIDRATEAPPKAALEQHLAEIDELFGGETLRDIWTALSRAETAFARKTRNQMAANAPLAMATALELIHRARARDRIDEALRNEYRFAHRIAAHGDFQEGIRAAIIDRDTSAKWAHATPDAPTIGDVSAMLLPLGKDELTLEANA
ncbi:MAG: enoyl-CoA hydratase/isomerase family protein [Pseudomonadota bacterium]